MCDWDDEDFASGNTRHVAEHGVTPEEFQEVLDAADRRDVGSSKSDPTHMTIVGETRDGRSLRIVFELDEDDDFAYIRPITAYEPTD